MSIELQSVIPPRLASVPAFPTVAMRLLGLLGAKQVDAASVAACVASDPLLAGRLLKRANSADVARFEARDVLQAIRVLGMDRTREATLAAATLAYLGAAANVEVLAPCWRHTVACALISSVLARACGFPPGEAYTAGLLHDIGRLGLLTAYPAEYEMILAAGGQDGLMRRERDRFGVDHAEAGRWLAARWNLPPSIALVAEHHHDAPTGDLDQLAVVQMACRLADLLGFSVSESARPAAFEDITAVLPERERECLRERLPEIQESIHEQLETFSEAEDVALAKNVDVVIEEDEQTELLVEFPLAYPRRVAEARRKRRRRMLVTVLTLAAGLVVVLLLRR